MKIENITIKRRQIYFSDREFADINNARCWLKSALQFTRNNELQRAVDELQRAVDELENVLNNIKIQDSGKYYILNEEILRDDA